MFSLVIVFVFVGLSYEENDTSKLLTKVWNYDGTALKPCGSRLRIGPPQLFLWVSYEATKETYLGNGKQRSPVLSINNNCDPQPACQAWGLWQHLPIKGEALVQQWTVIGCSSTALIVSDEHQWPGKQCKDGGRRQSPIDIRSEDVRVDFDNKFIRFGPLKFTGYKGVLMTGVNNGLTVQFSSDGDPSIHPILTGGPLQHTYRLEQLHFHWLSEHAVNGRKYPMEIHFVHVRTDLTVPQALNEKDGLAIIAVFSEVESKLSLEQDDRIHGIMEIVPLLVKTGNRVSGVLLNLMDLLGPSQTSYYAYEGSLTSPECNEAVIWIIFEKPLAISDAQYRLFGKIGVSRHNFRSLQPLRHHLVFKVKPDSPYEKPTIVTAVSNFFNDIKLFFQNVTRYALSKISRNYYACRNFSRNNNKYGLT